MASALLVSPQHGAFGKLGWMSHALHSLALIAAAIGLCSAAVDRGRDRLAMAVAATLMLFAMADSALPNPLLPAVTWMALLIVTAIVFAAAGRVRVALRAVSPPAKASTLHIHSASGLVVMAALLAPHAAAAVASPTANHAHGLTGPTIGTLLVGSGVIYALASVVAATRSGNALHGIHLSAMGASAGLMAIGLAL